MKNTSTKSTFMKKDGLLKRFFADKRRFADIINGFACYGEQYVLPEDLQELDAKEGIWRNIDTYDYSSNGGNSFFPQAIREKNRDIIWQTAFGVNFAIVGLENQEKIDYSMPYRVMSYDVSRYDKQMAEIRRDLRDSKQSMRLSEYLYSFKKDSKLHPVVTFVLYYGEEEYDGAVDLHGIIDFTNIPQCIKDMVQNYRINLIDIRRIENLDMLKTDVRTVFELIRDANDEEKWRTKLENTKLQREAADVVNAYMKLDIPESVMEEITDEGGLVDMCKAWNDGIERGRAEGKAEGRATERTEMLVQLIKKGYLTLDEAVKEFGVEQEKLKFILAGNNI